MPLKLWKDLLPEGKPLRPPSSSAAHILVIGGGVIGVTTAWLLLDKGYKVTIISKEWASYSDKQRLTSQVAGALWEYPPAVCGHHTDIISLTNSKGWCMINYHIWDTIATLPSLSKASGVRMKRANFFFTHRIADNPALLQKTEEMRTSGIRGFTHATNLIHKHGINPAYGILDAFELLAPVIDTDTCMDWLTKLVQEKGAILTTKTITGDIFTQEPDLRQHFNADAIVNATGLGALDLAGDKACYPIRGALLRLINDGTDFPKINAAMAVPAGTRAGTDPSFPSNEIVFLVPRSDNILVVGGITEPHAWDLDFSLDSPIIRRMRARCESFLPVLKNARADNEYPLAQGLRPFRGENVRVERELRRHGERPSRIVHNYGHGGAGWSLSFGCAGDVLKLVEDALLDLAPVAMDVMVLDGHAKL
ncbi:FAD dependent oxidoreductase [Aspergillus cavernicola]|uniref:FAD dependent oxidoreductase n=1 Tax=Aspergillus cavernicola TaxID=176166 RepID=A0ABR4HRN2_9EURO